VREKFREVIADKEKEKQFKKRREALADLALNGTTNDQLMTLASAAATELPNVAPGKSPSTPFYFLVYPCLTSLV
jgi:hypothetical protein